jgi:hypothetical protein
MRPPAKSTGSSRISSSSRRAIPAPRDAIVRELASVRAARRTIDTRRLATAMGVLL